MSRFLSSDRASSILATKFISKLAADNNVSKFLDQFEQIGDDDVCGHSVCKSMFRSWQSIISMHPDPSYYTLDTTNSSEKGIISIDKMRLESDLWTRVFLDFTWSKLNSGQWNGVSLIWREMYATAALFKGIALLSHGRAQESLGEIDRGILLGAPVFSNALTSFASTLTREISAIEQGSYNTSCGKEIHVNMSNQAFFHQSGEQEGKEGIGKVVFKNYGFYHKPKTWTITQSNDGTSYSRGNNWSVIPIMNMKQKVSVVNCPSLEEFYCNFMMRSSPVVLSGVMDDWPAYAKRKWRYVHPMCNDQCTSS